MSPKLFKSEDLKALPPYTPLVGKAREGVLQCLAHKSPNGIWWSTYKNAVSVEELLEVFDEGFEVLHTRSASDEPNEVNEAAYTALFRLENYLSTDNEASSNKHILEDLSTIRVALSLL